MKIKQCQCGNRDLITVEDSYGFSGYVYHVECKQCGRSGERVYNCIGNSAKKGAVKAWNREVVINRILKSFT